MWGIQLGLDILALVGRVPELSSLRAEEPLEKMAYYKEIRLKKWASLKDQAVCTLRQLHLWPLTPSPSPSLQDTR